MIEKLPNNLLNIIKNGESSTVEFKKATNKLPNNLFETICAMLNRNGGHIFLGVEDSGKVVGIYKNATKDMKKNFANLCNNLEKISPSVHLDMYEYEYDSKIILYTYVYESSDVHKTTNKIYDRNEDGDFDITNNTILISNLYIKKCNTYIENKIYPYATIKHLRSDLIERARVMAHNRDNNHPWTKMNDLELLKSASLYEYDMQTGMEGINLAGILLFGKDETIKSALSYYKTDAILRVKDLDRYDDRDDIRTNLIESYDRLMNFMTKHLDDRFYLEGDQRIDVRSKIARELCVNLLIHREFSNPIPARLIITKDNIQTENANKPKNIGYIDLSNYTPYPKNPKIAAVFKEIGLADELGSGFKKIMKYTKIYSNGIPLFKDGDVFKATIPLMPNHENNRLNLSNVDYKEKLYEFITNHNGVTRKEINDYMYPLLNLGSSECNSKVRYYLRKLNDEGKIDNIGSDKKPIWILSAVKTQ